MAPKKAPPTPKQLAKQIESQIETLEMDEAEELKYNGLIARNKARGLNVQTHEMEQFELAQKIFMSKKALLRQMRQAEKMMDNGKDTPENGLDIAYEKGRQHLERDELNAMFAIQGVRTKNQKKKEAERLLKSGVIKVEKNNNNANRLSRASLSTVRENGAPSQSRNSFFTSSRSGSGASISSVNTSNSANSSVAKRRKTSHANSLNSKRNFYNKVARQFIELKAKTNLEKAILLKRQGEVAQGVKTYVADFKKKKASQLKKIPVNDQRYHIAQEFVGRPIHLHMANGRVRKFDALTNKMKKLMKQSPMKIHA